MIVLPRDIQTTMLKSFWIIFCSITISLITALLYLITKSVTSLGALVLLPILIYPGYKSPDKLVIPYKIINQILFKIRGLVRRVSLNIIYYIFFLSYKLTENENKMDIGKSPKDSMWNLKTIINITGEEGEYDVSFDNTVHFSWLRSYIKWVKLTGKWWLISIIPFIYIISITTDSKDRTSIAHDTYTLY
jgi:hypothetical protein